MEHTSDPVNEDSGGNPGSSKYTLLNITSPFRELVWSPSKGLCATCLESNLAREKAPVIWNTETGSMKDLSPNVVESSNNRDLSAGTLNSFQLKPDFTSPGSKSPTLLNPPGSSLGSFGDNGKGRGVSDAEQEHDRSDKDVDISSSLFGILDSEENALNMQHEKHFMPGNDGVAMGNSTSSWHPVDCAVGSPNIAKGNELVHFYMEDSRGISKEKEGSRDSLQSSNNGRQIPSGKRALSPGLNLSGGSRKMKKQRTGNSFSRSFVNSCFVNWIAAITNSCVRYDQEEPSAFVRESSLIRRKTVGYSPESHDKSKDPDVSIANSSVNKVTNNKNDFLESMWIKRLCPKVYTSRVDTVPCNQATEQPTERLTNNCNMLDSEVDASKKGEIAQFNSKSTLHSSSLNESEKLVFVFAKRLDAFRQIRCSGVPKDVATSSTATCFYCGKIGHKISDCSELVGTEIDELLKIMNSYEGTIKSSCFCIRCLELNHWAISCSHSSSQIYKAIRQLHLTRTDIAKWMKSRVTHFSLEGFFLRLWIGRRKGSSVVTGYHVACINGVNCENELIACVEGFTYLVDFHSVSNRDFVESPGGSRSPPPREQAADARNGLDYGESPSGVKREGSRSPVSPPAICEPRGKWSEPQPAGFP